jgi:NitT/TauT family transport system ATP-binding protein
MAWHNVRKNVRLALELSGVKGQEADDRAAQALRLVGLEKFASALPKELSGGMQMRVSIARGLITNPDLLLMDEPFGALDEITRFKLDAELLHLWQQNGFTVIFVTHSIHEAVFLSQRVIVMAARPGRVIDEVFINEPFPRSQEFRMSEKFSNYAMQLHQSLTRASNEETR